MKTLDDIGRSYGTDKSSSHHHYLPFYELLFEPLRYKKINIIEIGVQFGNSIRTWRDYFVHAHIIGLDCIDNGVKFGLEDGIFIEICNAYSINTVERFEGKFDIIIDDGSHYIDHQKFVLENYLSLLTDDGVLVIEDVLKEESIPKLASTIPDEFNYVAVDMTQGRSLVDSRLLLVWRKESNHL